MYVWNMFFSLFCRVGVRLRPRAERRRPAGATLRPRLFFATRKIFSIRAKVEIVSFSFGRRERDAGSRDQSHHALPSPSTDALEWATPVHTGAGMLDAV